MNKSIKISTYVLIVIFFLPNVILSKEKDIFLTLRYNKVKVRSGPSRDHPVKFIYKKKIITSKNY